MADALTDPRSQALLNTSPAELDTLAASFSKVSGQAQTSSSGLRGAHGDLHWTGTSADLFRTKLGKLPDDLDTVDTSYAQIAAALRTYATHVEPIKSKFVPIYNQLGTDSSSLTNAQGSASSAQTAYKTAANAKGAKPSDTAVSGAHTTLTTAQGKVTRLQGEVSGLNTSAVRLLDEFDTVRGQCISQIKDAAGKAPQHHSSFWGSVCHIADDVGHFIGKTATGIYHDVTDLPHDAVNFVEHPSWKTFGKLATDVAVTASIVVMVAAPFAAPELLEADGAAVAATDVATDAATDATADAATDAATDTATDTVTDTATDGAKTYSTFTKAATYTDKYGSDVVTTSGLLNADSDAAQGNWKAAALDLAFVAAPNLGKVPRSIGDVKTLGDRTADVLHIGDGTAAKAASNAEAAKDFRILSTWGINPVGAKSLTYDYMKDVPKALRVDDPTGAAMNGAVTDTKAAATRASSIAAHVGKPAAISLDLGTYEPIKEKLKDKLAPEPEPVGAGTR